MKIKLKLVSLAVLLLSVMITAEVLKTASRVPNVKLFTLGNVPAWIPYYGEKHMMVFYVDPDAYRQNRDFQRELAEDGKLGMAGRTASPNIQGYGVLNLADTMLSSKVVRDMTRLIAADTPSIILADPNHTLRDAWGLGEVNDKFVLMFVTKNGEMVYYRKGKFTQADKDEFYRIVGLYR